MTAKEQEYSFTHNGQTYTIPSFAALPMGALRKARNSKNETDQVFTILEAVMPENSPELAAVDTMSSAEFTKWLDGWTGGASVGESSGSEN